MKRASNKNVEGAKNCYSTKSSWPDKKTTKGQKRNYLKILVKFYKLQIFLNIYHVYQLNPS